MWDTKERILDTALRLFARSGFEAVSVSEIATELSITKGALYKHYKNKRDIFDSIVKKCIVLTLKEQRNIMFRIKAMTYSRMHTDIRQRKASKNLHLLNLSSGPKTLLRQISAKCWFWNNTEAAK